MNIKLIRFPTRFIQNSISFKKFEQLSLKNKLLISFLFVSIIPILLVQTLSYYNSTISMKNKINDLIHFNLVQTTKNIDTTLVSFEDLVVQILSDEIIIEQVKKLNHAADVERLLASIELRRKFSIISLSKPGVKCISVLGATGNVAWYDRDNNSGIRNIWDHYPDVTQTEIYRKALKGGNWVLFGPNLDSYSGKHYINVALKLSDWKNQVSQCLGVVVLSIDENYLYNSCNQSIRDPNRADSFNFIYDNQGRIISFPVKKYLGKQIFHSKKPSSIEIDHELNSFIRQSGILGERELIINRLFDREKGWTIVNAIDQHYLFNQMYWMQKLNIIFGVFVVLFSVMIITYVTRTLSRSTNKIVSAMNIARKGELSIQVDLDTQDELSMIGSHFNKMMIQLQQLMEEVKVATSRQKEAEIKALVAQINPHFLYNMLDSINWMAIDKDEHEISQMIESLANILRYSINDSNWEVTLREEMEWLKQYIYLQQNHFDNSFKSIIQFEESILDCKIYKLLLQPLVENAIIHGFKGYNSGGILKITGELKGENIKITIQDNGRGIVPETLNAITRDIQERRGFSGIGIRNVVNRIQMYYGDTAKLSFESETGQGTTVTLLIRVY